MLDFDEADEVQKLFASTQTQVRRDHAISHVLAGFQSIPSEMTFFGGTALARTYLTQGRLSEDIDLYSSNRQSLTKELDGLPNKLEEEFPRAYWDGLPSQTSDSQSTLLICDTSIQIKVQVVDSRPRGWQIIPTELTAIHQRYSDVPSTKLFAPTFDGFVAMKALAWFDRGAPRDLFDLEALSQVGEVTQDARELVSELKGFPLTKGMLNRKIAGLWHDELAHQTKLDKTEDECLQRILEWWGQ